MTLKLSPLDACHRDLEARMVSFGGWEMPLSYPAGTPAEHLACRHGAAVFDVSHLGSVRVTGAGAYDLLQATLTNDLGKIAPGRAQYTHLLDDDGSVLDDIIVWWVTPERFDVMPNASNTSRVVAALGGQDVTADRAVIAVQGPTARTKLASISPAAAVVPRFRVTTFEWEGVESIAAGTGYTGEDGVECAVPRDHAATFWTALIETGVVPAGLGARDTLRLEAGLPLHGHELGKGISPLQAGLSWVVAWDKGDFPGRRALVAERERGLDRRLRGLLSDSRRPLRAGLPVLRDGAVVGETTSGNFSPVLERGIALALLPPDLKLDDEVEVDVRGRLVSAHVVKPPFVETGG